MLSGTRHVLDPCQRKTSNLGIVWAPQRQTRSSPGHSPDILDTRFFVCIIEQVCRPPHSITAIRLLNHKNNRAVETPKHKH
eukprot:1979552-Amphidinium_carterae.2